MVRLSRCLTPSRLAGALTIRHGGTNHYNYKHKKCPHVWRTSAADFNVRHHKYRELFGRCKKTPRFFRGAALEGSRARATKKENVGTL